MLQKSRQTECIYERFHIQSHVASDFCGSFRVKQHSLFPPFDLPRETLVVVQNFGMLYHGRGQIKQAEEMWSCGPPGVGERYKVAGEWQALEKWQALENGSRWRMVVAGEWQALEKEKGLENFVPATFSYLSLATTF